jgi:activating signal cointegrator 1
MVTRWESGRFCKIFETRSWATKYRGPIAIHSSAKHPKDIFKMVMRSPFKEAFQVGKDPCDWFSNEDFESNLPRGVVIGIGRLVDCIPVEVPSGKDSIHPKMTLSESCFGDYSPGRFAWLIEDMHPLKEPVPAKGMLGLWEWEPTDEAMDILNLFDLREEARTMTPFQRYLEKR